MDGSPVKETVEKIAKEFQEAGATKWDILKIIKGLENEKQPEKKLRKKAVELLREINPKAAEVYSSFEKLSVYSSSGVRESFDRGNIIHSLLKETTLSRTTAEKIGAEVEDKIKDLNINYLNTALIREMVNVKLLEFGQEEAHRQYARLGLPVFDVKKKLSRGIYENKDILLEFNWLEAIPEKARQLHFDSLAHIVAAEDFSSKPYAQSTFLKLNSTSIENAVIEFGKKLGALKKFSSLAPAARSANFSFAKLLGKSSKKKKRFYALMLLGQVDRALFECTDVKPVLGLDLFSDGELDLSPAQIDDAVDFALETIHTFNENRSEFNFSIAVSCDSKFRLKLIDRPLLEKGLLFLNCSKQRVVPLTEKIYLDKGQGISQYFGLNLEKMAFDSQENGFFELLEETLGEFKAAADLKETILSEKPYLKENEIEIEKFVPALGIYGLESAAMNLGGEGNAKLAEKMLSAVLKSTGNKWVVNEFSDAAGIAKFAEVNRKFFAEVPEAKGNALAPFKKNFLRLHSCNSIKELEALMDENAEFILLDAKA